LKRRDFLQFCGMGIIALAVNQYLFAKNSSKRFPNIIFILADDLGYGDVSCLNPESKIHTPNLDNLASEGITFTDAHSGSGVCTPTRYGILTGRYSWRSILKKGVLQGHSRALISSDRLTVADLLKKAGYKTACIGKWHLGMDWPTKDGRPAVKGLKNVDFKQDIKNSPLDFGFDYFFGISGSLGMAPHTFIENRRVVVEPTIYVKDKKILHGKLINGREGWMAKDWDPKKVLPEITRKAVNFIKQTTTKSPGQPFFLYFALTSPHKPVVPNDEFIGKSQAGYYGDFVVETDWVVGQILQTVRNVGIEQNTIIIFTSDNGPERTKYEREKRYHHDSTAHFRGCKRDNWEGGHRIPFFAKWPGRIKPGSICNEPICLTDFMATCAEITGQKLPDNAGEDSYSILPLLLGKKINKPIREAVIHHSSRGYFAIRQGEWKLLLHEGSGGNKYNLEDDSPIQLYNIKKDKYETKNVADKYPDIVQRMGKLIKKYILEGRSTPGAPQKNDGSEFWPQ